MVQKPNPHIWLILPSAHLAYKLPFLIGWQNNRDFDHVHILGTWLPLEKVKKCFMFSTQALEASIHFTSSILVVSCHTSLCTKIQPKLRFRERIAGCEFGQCGHRWLGGRGPWHWVYLYVVLLPRVIRIKVTPSE